MSDASRKPPLRPLAPAPAARRLEHDHVAVRRPRLGVQRGPQPRVAAADDAQVRVGGGGQRLVRRALRQRVKPEGPRLRVGVGGAMRRRRLGVWPGRRHASQRTAQGPTGGASMQQVVGGKLSFRLFRTPTLPKPAVFRPQPTRRRATNPPRITTTKPTAVRQDRPKKESSQAVTADSRPSSRPAPASTVRIPATISSSTASSEMSGGAICRTASPRSSARAMRPASRRAPGM